MPDARPNGGDAAARQNELPDVSCGATALTSPPESIPKGGCAHCLSALMPVELRWRSGQCDRCYNKAQGGAKCGGCQKGLWKCELNLPSRRCCECEAHRCKRCEEILTAVEVRWENQYCNRCYNLWRGTTQPCEWCRRGLLLPEIRWGSMYCGPCRDAWRRF